MHSEVPVGPAAANKGKDMKMAIIFHKASLCRTSILLWLLVGSAALLPGSLGALFATADTSPPQGISAKRMEDEAVVNKMASQSEAQVNENEDARPSSLTKKQRRNLMKANFEKMKRDAGQLTDLAKALQEELNKSNENILSLDIVDKADKIEKLAKKIKGTARGF